MVISTILAVIIIVMLIKWPKYVTISDEAPKSGSKKDAWLKLQNEGASYIEFKDGKVFLKIKK